MGTYDLATSGPATSGRAAPAAAPRARGQELLRQLYQLYAAERQLDRDLLWLFRRAATFGLRLVLADCRRATDRQILRLENIIQALTGSAGTAMAISIPADLYQSLPYTTRPGPILMIPLRSAQAALENYGAALAIARERGPRSLVDLLAESLQEKRAATAVLSHVEEFVD